MCNMSIYRGKSYRKHSLFQRHIWVLPCLSIGCMIDGRSEELAFGIEPISPQIPAHSYAGRYGIAIERSPFVQSIAEVHIVECRTLPVTPARQGRGSDAARI